MSWSEDRKSMRVLLPLQHHYYMLVLRSRRMVKQLLMREGGLRTEIPYPFDVMVLNVNDADVS